MGGGVTTGSLLNQRVFNRNGGSGSSNKGGGVKRHELLNTKITLADRNKGIGRTSYTALSNSINGRKEVIYVGGGSKCSGTSSMSTMEKIAMWNSIAQQGLQLGQGIAGLFKSGKSDAPAGTVKNQGVTPSGTELKQKGPGSVQDVAVNSNTKVAGNDLASTINIVSGDSFVSNMENADGSADLQKAIVDARTYLNGDLSTRRANAKTAKETAEQRLDAMKKGNELKTAEEERDTAQSQVNAFKKQNMPNMERNLNTAKSNLQQAEDDLGKLDSKYKTAVEARRTGEIRCSKADKNLASATAQFDSASQAKDRATNNYNTLKSQLDALPADDAGRAALEAQVSAAETAKRTAEDNFNKAKSDKEAAETEKNNAYNDLNKNLKPAEIKALNGVNTGEKAIKDAKANLTTREGELETAQTQYNTAQKELETRESNLKSKQDAFDKLTQEKEKLENDIKNFEKLDKEYNSLSKEIKEQEDRCIKMQQDEQKELEKLQKKEQKAGERSDRHRGAVNWQSAADGTSELSGSDKRHAKRMVKAENKQNDYRAQIDALQSKSYSGTLSFATQEEKDKATLMSQTDTHKFDPFAKVKSSFEDVQSEQKKNDNEMQLNLLKSTGFATINGKTITKMPVGDSYVVEGKIYTFDELKTALQAGQI